jgi:hypothetical protein
MERVARNRTKKVILIVEQKKEQIHYDKKKLKLMSQHLHLKMALT